MSKTPGLFLPHSAFSKVTQTAVSTKITSRNPALKSGVQQTEMITLNPPLPPPATPSKEEEGFRIRLLSTWGLCPLESSLPINSTLSFCSPHPQQPKKCKKQKQKQNLTTSKAGPLWRSPVEALNTKATPGPGGIHVSIFFLGR